MPIGEIAALTAAFFWATATLLFKGAGKTVRPLELNLFKGVIALIFFFATILIGRISFGAASASSILLLAAAGISGIGIGDTLFFSALTSIGARRTLLIQMLSPPLAALLSWSLFKEAISLSSWLGVLITIGGISWVITERTGPDSGQKTSRKQWQGILYAGLAALASATGVVLTRSALTGSTINIWWSVVVRLGAGVGFLLIFLLLYRMKSDQPILSLPTEKKVWLTVLLASVLGTYIALFFNQTALRYAPAGIAQTLLSTSPLFVLPLGLFFGERISWRAVAGAVIACGGIAVFFWL